MSTLSTSKITTLDSVTNLSFTTGNNNSGNITVFATNNTILFDGDPVFSGTPTFYQTVPFNGDVIFTDNVSFDTTRSTRIWDPVANNMAFYTSQVEAVRIDPNGNVLIGRSDSTIGSEVKLDVAGTANASQYYINGTLATEIANSYAQTSTAASNGWTNSVFGYVNTGIAGANSWVNTVFGYTNTGIAGANSWTNTVFGYSNTYARTVSAASNGWTNSVFGYSNTYAQTVSAASNGWTNTVFGYSNTYAQTIGAASNGWTNTVFGYANSKFIANNVSNTAVFGGNVFISGLATIGSATSNVYLGDTWAYANLGTALANSNSGFIINQTWNNASNNFTAFKVNVANTNSGGSSYLADFQVDGTSRFRLFKNGQIVVLGTVNDVFMGGAYNGMIAGGAGLNYHPGALTCNSLELGTGSVDNPFTYIYGEASNTAALRRTGLSPTTYRLYNHYFDSANNNRLAIQWQANTINISSEAYGNGSLRPIAFTMNTATVLTLETSGNSYTSGSLGIGTNTDFSLSGESLRIVTVGTTTNPGRVHIHDTGGGSTLLTSTGATAGQFRIGTYDASKIARADIGLSTASGTYISAYDTDVELSTIPGIGGTQKSGVSIDRTGNVSVVVLDSTLMKIQSTGNVMIGKTTSTTGDGVKLDVAGGVSANVVKATTFLGVGSGFSNASFVTATGTGTWTIPTGVRRFKVTAIGGGGQGGGTSTTAGQVGNGGGSGGVCIKYYDVVDGVTTMSYNVGSAGSGAGTNTTGNPGTPSNTNYNNIWAFANAGGGGATHGTVNGGGAGGAASGGTYNITGFVGLTGGVAAATNPVPGQGAATPLGWGQGGEQDGTAAGGNGTAGNGYGAGGSGGKNGSGTTARSGGAGLQGALLIEW